MYTLLCVALVHTSVRRKCTHYAAVSNPCIISHSESILVRSLNEKQHGVETAALVCVAHVHTIMRCKCTCICAYRACVYTICVFKTYIDISLLVAVGTAGTWETHESSCNNMQSSNKKVYACTACTSVHTYDYHCTQCLATSCNELQRVALCGGVLQRSVCMYTYECWHVHLSLNSVICNKLQWVAVRCSVLQCVAEVFTCTPTSVDMHIYHWTQWSAVRCSTLQRVAACCSAWQCVADVFTCTPSSVDMHIMWIM